MAVDDFFGTLGVGESNHTLTDNGITPPVAGLISAKYVITYWKDLSGYFDLLKEYRGYKIFENKNALPFALVSSLSDVDCKPLSEDPFENINIVYNDLLYEHLKGEDIFVKQPILYEENYSIEDLNKELCKGVSVGFIPMESGDYWIYTNTKIDHDETSYETNEYGLRGNIKNLYLNGEKIGAYGDDDFNYSVDIGTLMADELNYLSLDGVSSENDVYVYYFNKKLFDSVVQNASGIDILEINKRHILLSGAVDRESEIILSLPYENGYYITVDGEKTDYYSYRNSLMVFKIDQGEHLIEIKYFPPGLKVGVTISILFITLTCLTLKKEL